MSKPRSLKFWIIFWTIATVFLAGWYAFLEFRRNVIQTIAPVLESLPFVDANSQDCVNAARIADYFLEKNDQEKIFLVLFQNNLEIRPGGGFIGTFGILKIKNGKIISLETQDLSNFDRQIPNLIEPPYPMKENLYIEYWKMRDSNYSPDFEVNAKLAEEFYRLGQGQENFDGVIGITTNVLTSILKVIGPVKLEDYPGTYDSENAVITLEYQVEKAFEEQGIERVERKSVMKELADEIENKILESSINHKLKLAKAMLQDLNKKNIQLYFKNPELQNVALNAGWAGEVDTKWMDDYLMMVDANLGSFKSDYYVNRSADYTVDFSGEIPLARLKITYQHTAKQKDWMTRDYFSYLRVYVPRGSWLIESKNFEDVRFGDEFSKKFFGGSVRVPIGQEKTVELVYQLPEKISADSEYNLKIQKQAGISNVPISTHIVEKDGSRKDYNFRLNSDITLDKLEK